jgi:hypothetical protein
MRNWGGGKRGRQLSVCRLPWLIHVLTGVFDVGQIIETYAEYW